MDLKRVIPLAAITLTISACGGSDFEWFPPVSDTTAPAISATVASDSSPGVSKPLFANRTTHVSSYPATVTFSSNEAATIYYTTNGSEPTTASASANSVTGPWPTIITDTVLKFFGIDKATQPNQSTTVTTYIKSP